MEVLLNYYDIVAVGVILVLALVYLYTIGKDYAVTIVLAQYMAIGTILFVPFLRELDFAIGAAPSWITKIAIFLILIVIFTYLQINNGYFEPYVVPSTWEIVVFATMFTGIFATVSIGFMPEIVTLELSDIMQMLFVEEPVSNTWFLLTPLALLFIKGQA